MKKLIVLGVLLSGCAASFQPFPGVTRADLEERDKVINSHGEALKQHAGVFNAIAEQFGILQDKGILPKPKVDPKK